MFSLHLWYLRTKQTLPVSTSVLQRGRQSIHSLQDFTQPYLGFKKLRVVWCHFATSRRTQTYKNTLFVPVIIDFGKCIRKQEASRKQEQETYKQKYTHVAPEVVAGTHPPSHASDVYALGRLLRQIATKIGCKPPLSLSECSLKNDPNARASLDHLLVSVKSLSSLLGSWY